MSLVARCLVLLGLASPSLPPAVTHGPVNLPDRAAAGAWADRNFGNWFERLTYSEIAAIRRYADGQAYDLDGKPPPG